MLLPVRPGPATSVERSRAPFGEHKSACGRSLALPATTPPRGGRFRTVPADERLPRGTLIFPEFVSIHFDGACQPPRGGVAAYGFVVDGLVERYEEYGPAVAPGSAHATNNVAEYAGAIRALEWLKGRGFKGEVLLLGDSELVIRQMNGDYAVRATHLRAYHERLRGLCTQFAEVRFHHVRREENRRADELSKLGIDVARRASAGRK